MRRPQTVHRRGPRRAAVSALLAALAALAGGCGSPARPIANCNAVVADALGGVAAHIYNESARGRNSASAVARIERSRSVRAAVARSDAAATKAALEPLIERQITRIEIFKGSRMLASHGHRPSLAPVRGVLRSAHGRRIGRFVLSVQGETGLVATIAGLTSGPALLRSGHHLLVGTIAPGPRRIPTRGAITYRGVAYQAFSFPAEAFPSGRLRLSVLIPPATPGTCASSAGQTTVNALRGVATRIYQGEQNSAVVSTVLRVAQHSQPFVRAVAHGDRRATRKAIEGFFTSHLHVVRVRALRGSQLLVDAGGPYALAPVEGALRDRRHGVVGRFKLAVQDDVGYVILAHRFTGAEVVLRTPAGEVPGSTLSGTPANLPDSGRVTIRGHDYYVSSFMAEAFPSGPLRISLLLPA